MKKQVQHSIGLMILILFFINVPNVIRAQYNKLHTIKVKNPAELRQFFRYTSDRIPFISAHRGGAREGYPENCIATFENTLRHVPAILEIDPRLTKDGVVVLMHDATLNRTTNGTGNVADHTWEELKVLKLKDPKGNVTQYGIPTLDEVLQWAKGKTILILDRKSVPIEITEKKIRDHKAESYAMIISYNDSEAKKYHELNKDIMMEVFLPNKNRVEEFDKSGVPWENVVGFIAHAKQEDKTIYDLIHQKGAMCIIGTGRIHDREYSKGNKGIYEQIIKDGADILEADLAIEAGMAISHLAPRESSKSKYFSQSKSTKKTRNTNQLKTLGTKEK